jgi:hypothetical protein
VRDALLSGASGRYGYPEDQIEFRLYVGRFAGRAHGDHERLIREWCADQHVGLGPIRVYGVTEVATAARRLAGATMYRDNPALVAIKVLQEAKMLTPIT